MKPRPIHKLIARSASKWNAETWCGANPRRWGVDVADYLASRPAPTCKACLREIARMETVVR